VKREPVQYREYFTIHNGLAGTKVPVRESEATLNRLRRTIIRCGKREDKVKSAESIF